MANFVFSEKMLEHFLKSASLTEAILEDYISVISKVENVPSDQIKKRIIDRSDILFNQFNHQMIQNLDESH